MNTNTQKKYTSHGDGSFTANQFQEIGENVIFENGVLVFHPENIRIGDNVYIGHNTILKGYYKNSLEIGENTWIGQGCFFHSAGNLTIGKAVGVGPMVKILTSEHMLDDLNKPILYHSIEFKSVTIEDGVDIGTGSTILPGVTIGEGAVIGAGSVVTKDIDKYAVAVGAPARVIRYRK